MTAVVPFHFDTWPVRAITIDGEPWFVARDIAEALRYVNPNKAIHDHCKGSTKRYPLASRGGVQETRLIAEPDVWRLIVGSQKEEAQRFERWLFEQVLPEIRRTGRFGGSPFAIPRTLADALQLAADLERDREQLTQRLKDSAEKVAALDRIADADGSLCVRDAAKSLGMKPRALYTWLAAHAWIFRRGKEWHAYQNHVDAEHLRMRAVPVPYTTDAGARTRLHQQVLLTAKGLTRLAAMLERPASPVAEREIARCAEALH